MTLGRRLERLLIGTEPVTILSDDCWGGEFCRSLGCAYTTPLAGVYVEPRDYLTFLENLDREDAFRLRPVPGGRAYPIGRTPYATLHFLHGKSWNEVERIFLRRVTRINRKRLFYKIDFGKPGYRQADVERWNALALPRAIALIPPRGRVGLDFAKVHQAVTVPRWVYDGIAMFHLSRRSFDFHYWIRTGRLRKSWLNRALNFLLWDAWIPSELTQRWRKLCRNRTPGPRLFQPAARELNNGPIAPAHPAHESAGRFAVRRHKV
jgi:uncharacterized protein (DUF1919 family)